MLPHILEFVTAMSLLLFFFCLKYIILGLLNSSHSPFSHQPFLVQVWDLFWWQYSTVLLCGMGQFATQSELLFPWRGIVIPHRHKYNQDWWLNQSVDSWFCGGRTWWELHMHCWEWLWHCKLECIVACQWYGTDMSECCQSCRLFGIYECFCMCCSSH